MHLIAHVCIGVLGLGLTACLMAQVGSETRSSDFDQVLAAATARASANPKDALAMLGQLRKGLPQKAGSPQRLALDEAECWILTNVDISRALSVAQAGLVDHPVSPAPPARAAWLNLRACRAGLLNDTGKAEEAAEELQALLQEADPMVDGLARALALQIRGDIKSRALDFVEGQSDLLQACELLRTLQRPRDLEFCSFNLAGHYQRAGDDHEALRLLEPLVERAQAAGANHDSMVFAYAQGRLLQRQDRWADSLIPLRTSEQLAELLGDEAGVAAARLLVARALLHMGQVASAHAGVLAAMAKLDRSQDPILHEMGRVLLAQVLVAMGRYEQALLELNRIDSSIHSADRRDGLAQIWRARADALAALQRWPEAFKAQEQVRLIDAQLHKEQLSRQSASLRMQFGRERDAEELASLRKLNEQGQQLHRLQGLALLLAASLVLLLLGLFAMKLRQARRLAQLASTDELTGLPNRRAALEAAEQALAVSRRNGRSMAVMVLDVDLFKRINDTHGHAVGDAALRHIAKTLAAVCRKADSVGRIGGEEFLAIMPTTSEAEAGAAAERVRAAIEASPLPASAKLANALPMTVSLGVAASAATEGVSELIARADQALYEAKGQGRNRVVVAGVPPEA